MAKDIAEGRPSGLSRREMLSAGAVIPVGLAASPAVRADLVAEIGGGADARSRPAPVIEGLETLTATEMDALEAICARLIPTDARGPGAKEARAAHYIDRALAGAMRGQRGAYTAGLSALNAYARGAKGKPFAELAPADQEAVLHDLEGGKAPGFTPNSAAFFGMVRAHTIEGTFCDPYYGGNADFVGWDLVGYPGIRMMVRPEDQRFAKPKALRHSAYEGGMFGRGSAA